MVLEYRLLAPIIHLMNGEKKVFIVTQLVSQVNEFFVLCAKVVFADNLRVFYEI